MCSDTDLLLLTVVALTPHHLTWLALLLQSGSMGHQSGAHAAYLEDVIEQLRVEHQQDISKLHQVHSHELQQVRQECTAQVSSALSATFQSRLSSCSAGLAIKSHPSLSACTGRAV